MMNSIAIPTAGFVFGFAGIATVNPQVIPDWMQYGAFGLCCVLVVFLLIYLKSMGDIIREKDKKFIELLEKDIASRNRLSQALEDRPCIMHDQRIENKG